MTPRKKSTKTGKKYFIKGKEEITDPTAPIVSDEFIDKQPEGDYSGQTLEVRSKTHLEADEGTGQHYILRTYEFATDPKYIREGLPDAQVIFESHMKGIAGMLWADGFTPVTELQPRIIFRKDKVKYLIMVWARPSVGQIVTDKSITLSEIAHTTTHAGNSHSRQNTNKV